MHSGPPIGATDLQLGGKVRTQATSPEAAHLARWIELGVLFSLLAGMLDPGLREIVGHLGELSSGRHVVWMAPLSCALFLLPLACALAALVRLTPALVTERRGVAILAFVAAIDVLASLSSNIHWAALLILAGGVGAGAARLLASPGMPPRSIRPAIATLAAAVTVLAIAVWMVPRRAANATQPAPPPGATSVLLVVLDAVRADEIETSAPALKRLAGGGVRFDRAFSTASWTLPSHASLFTGHLPHELSVTYRRPLDDRFTTLAEVLARRGYATGGFVGNPYYTARGSGLARGFLDYHDVTVSAGQVLVSSWLGRYFFGGGGRRRSYLAKLVTRQPPPGRRDAAAVTGEFRAWLDRLGDRPFFAFFNLFDAHYPYEPPPEYATPGSASPRDRYNALVRYIDHELGAALDDLDRRGRLANTLVIVTADHGEGFGEHDLVRHAQSLYASEVRVPLVLVLPDRVPEGRHIDAPVSLRDIPVTVLQLLGADTTATFPGRSLSRYWSPAYNADSADAVLSELDAVAPSEADSYIIAGAPQRSVVAGRWHYLCCRLGEELYDLDADSLEARNLAADSAARLPALRRLATGLRTP